MVSPKPREQQPIPDHVPAELVHDIGHIIGPEFLKAPHEYMAGLHDRYPPLFYNSNAITGNGWITISHTDAYTALRAPEYFTVQDSAPFPRDPDNFFHLIPLEIDPPEHRKYRSVLDPMLSPRAVQQLEADIRKLANTLIDDLIHKGECDFAEDFARPLPVSVFLNFMGLPLDMRDQFVEWVVGLIVQMGGPDSKRIIGEIETYLSSVIEEKRKTPDNGAISRIVHAEVDGAPMKERDVYGFTFFLFIAGIDTVYAALNNIWVLLAGRPDLRQQVIDDPDNINAQVEELLRLYAPTFSGRKLVKDYEMRGVTLKKGDSFLSLLPACNYDPAIFDNPKRADFHRQRRPILTFTGGVHSCMGAHLARLEVKVALQEWMRRIPDFEIKPGAEIKYPPSGVVGPAAVPLVW